MCVVAVTPHGCADFELDNLIPQVKEQLYKLASLTLCANTHGQITTGLMVNPPRKGEESFAEFEAQSGAILASLKRRAHPGAETSGGGRGLGARGRG